MGSPARKIRQDEREKPRDTSRDFALPYPVECPALVTNDDVVRAWSLLFLPAFAAGKVDSFDLQVQAARHELTGNTWQWYPVRRKKPSLAYVRTAVESHIIAGETGKPCHLDGEGPIRAIGAKFRKDTPTCIMNVDLDGRYDVREVVRSFASIGVYGLLVSSSGRSGRFRYLVFLDRWYTIDELQMLGKTLCESLGFAVDSGALELYPSHGNGRLPGGLGSLTRYHQTNLESGTNLTLPCFVREMYALQRVRLAQIVDELKFAAERSEQEKRIFGDIFPEFETVLLEQEQPSNDQKTRKHEQRKRGQTRVPKDVSRWIEKGVEPGERQRAIVALTMHAWFQGKNHGETIAYLADWIRQGGLDRSRFVHEHENAIQRQIADVPRTVTNIFARCGTFKRSAVNAPPAHLSAADLLLLNADVERVIAQGRLEKPRWTPRLVKEFCGAVLPFFKGAAVDGHVDDQGRPIVQLHWERWESSAGGRGDYAKLRSAFGWFVPITDYLPAKWASDPNDAYATTWAFVPQLTKDAPARALGRTWDLAIIAAAKRQKRQARKQDKSHPREV